MNILSIIYSIPAVPYSSSSMYSALSDSSTTLVLMSDSSTPLTPTRSSSPSPSPSSDSSPRIPQNSQIHQNIQNDYQLHLDEQVTYEREFLGPEAVSSAMFPLGTSGPAPHSTSHHPYANDQYDPPQPLAISVAPLNRLSVVHRRARASSNLPPPPPPPSSSLPPAPTAVVVEPPAHTASSQRQPDVRIRHQSDLAGHMRTGSSGLEVLTEEHDDVPDGSRRTIDEGASRANPAPRSADRDSHPLPPIPSPSTVVPATPRNPPLTKSPPSPRSSNIVAHRPRGTSQLTTRSEIANQPAFINPTTTQGTIFQRRTKTSVPPSSRSTSPADSIASAGSSPHPKSTASSLPGITTIGTVPGRSRASSQPGRRPSLVGGRISPLDPRPPLPGTTSVNQSAMRKSSVPSKFNPSTQPSQLSIQTDVLQPHTGSALSLVPPPPVFTGNLPTTPTSPLPQAPPTDPLLKPYYMMSLLRTTMISTTGGYLTRRLHVPHEVWSQGGAKLSNVLDKVRVVAILCSALEELQNSSSEHFGAGNVSSGLALGIGSIGKKEADAWLTKLEDFSSVCDGVVTNFGKKLGVGEGFVLKKTTWGDKLTRSFDKFTNGKK
jgi:hypothetical protein